VIGWSASLSFDAETTREGPLPVNAMQLVTHHTMLYRLKHDRICGAIETPITHVTA
jgi:hypothetical protein